QVVGDPDAGLDAQEGAGVLADAGGFGAIQGGRQGQVFTAQDGFYEHAAHAAVRSRNGDTHSVVPWYLGLTEGFGCCAGRRGRAFRGARRRADRRCAGVGALVGLALWLGIALPADQGIAFEPDAEAPLFRFAIARLAVIGVIPAV